MGEPTKFSRADVAARNGKNSTEVWVIIKDQVYDLSKYMYEHPGGDSVIKDVAGGDGTRDFDDAAHSADAKNIMTKYRIGEIIEEEKHYDANGKKKKRVVPAPPEGKPEGRSCIGVVTCGLLG